MKKILSKKDKFLNDALKAEFDAQNLENLDAKFLVENKPLYAHRWMLKQYYPMLFYTFFDKNDEVAVVENVPFKEFKDFLRFLYTLEVNLNEDNIYVFESIAKKYDFQMLKKKCNNYLAKAVTLENVQERFECIQDQHMTYAYGRIHNFIIMNDTEIVKNIGLHNLPKSFMQIFIGLQTFGFSPEEKFNKAIEWAKAQCTAKQLELTDENCRNQLGDILNKIKFDKMDIKFLETIVAESQILTKPELLKIISSILSKDDKCEDNALTAEFDAQNLESLDAKFLVENKSIYAHRWMLKQYYPVLFYTFFDLSNEAAVVENISFKEFKDFLRFLYTLEIKLNDENITVFTNLAFQYSIISLQKLCEDYLYINMTFQNAQFIIQNPEVLIMRKLRTKIYKFMLEHKLDFLQNISELSKPLIKALISIQTAEEGFKNAIEWAKAQCTAKQLELTGENCRNQLSDVFNKIKFYKMDIKFLETIVAESQILTKPELFEIIPFILSRLSLNDLLTAEFDAQNLETLDAKFLVENKPIYAFKWLLKIRCPILLKLFTESSYFTDVTNGVIIGGDVDFDEFRDFLRYLYTNKIELNEKNIFAQTDLATLYDVTELRNRCEIYLSLDLTLENAQPRFKCAELYEMPKALKKIGEFIISENIDFWKDNDLLNLSKSMIEACIKTKVISNFPEVEYIKVMEWAKNKCNVKNLEATVENCRNELGDMFELIRFEEMSPRFITTTVAESQVFTDKERLKLMDKIAMNFMRRSSVKLILRCYYGCRQEIHIMTQGGDKKLLLLFIETVMNKPLEFGYWYTIEKKFRHSPKSIPPEIIQENTIVLLAEYRDQKLHSIYFKHFRKPWSNEKIILGIFDQHNLTDDRFYKCFSCGPRWESASIKLYNKKMQAWQEPRDSQLRQAHLQMM